MIQDPDKYEKWLTTIANTRLIYNTMDELEAMLDNYSIHSNGIRRSFASRQKMRAAYRDLKVEVELMTDGLLDLDTVMLDYQLAWMFFRDNLRRRTYPEEVAMELLAYCYPPYIRKGKGAKKGAIYRQIVDLDINVPLLLLMLLKVIPGFDSKDGDVEDMASQYDRVMNLLERFICFDTDFSVQPSITGARECSRKSRLMLLHHVSNILDTYEAYADKANIYDTSGYIKGNGIYFDIDGYWNECKGELLYTDFWQIEDLNGAGSYFMTHWHKDADNRLTGIRYSLFISEGPDGKPVCYIQHPKTIWLRTRGRRYGDADHVWYNAEWGDETPHELPLHRRMYSAVWPLDINLTRCTDEGVVSQYDRWLNHDCEIVRPFRQFEYVFRPNLYAITRTHIYIASENEREFYKVPRTAHEGFERINMDDNVGTMTMNGRTYLVFDELQLYINASRKELQKYGIERVGSIE